MKISQTKNEQKVRLNGNGHNANHQNDDFQNDDKKNANQQSGQAREKKLSFIKMTTSGMTIKNQSKQKNVKCCSAKYDKTAG